MRAEGIVKTALVRQQETGEIGLEREGFPDCAEVMENNGPQMEVMLADLSGSGSGRQWRKPSPCSFSSRTELIQGLCGPCTPFSITDRPSFRRTH